MSQESEKEKDKNAVQEQEKQEVKPEDLDKKIIHIEAERLERKRQELLEVEDRIDKKMQAFKKFVDNTEIGGKALAGAAVEPTDEDKAKAAANKLLEGTGLSI